MGDDLSLSPVLANGAVRILHTDMFRLEQELQRLMQRNVLPLDSDGLSYFRGGDLSFSDGLSCSFSCASGNGEALFEDFSSFGASSLMDDRNVEEDWIQTDVGLKATADRMIQDKYNRKLRDVYCKVRRETLDECLCNLGVGRLHVASQEPYQQTRRFRQEERGAVLGGGASQQMNIEEVQRMKQQRLDKKMKEWAQAVEIVVKVLLPEEKLLCNNILEAASEELRAECFMEATKGCMMQLLNFGEAIAMCPPPPSSENLFLLLDMYKVLAGVLPELQELFSGSGDCIIPEEAAGMLKRLGHAARGLLSELEQFVMKETTPAPSVTMPAEGGIHPLTLDVVNYIVRLLVDYSHLLPVLLDEKVPGDDDDDSHHQSVTPFGGGSRHILLIISYLESNLEEMAKLYKDGALKYIFLMNNIFHIVQTMNDNSELRRFLGDDWISKRRGKARQYAISYLRTCWTKLLSLLKEEGIWSDSSSGVSKVALKERFKNFNLAFEEIYRVQTAWKVPDPQLREELRISISERVIPAYRSFMGRICCRLNGRNAAKYIKYSGEDLESHLSDFFEGKHLIL